jgi:hypothetical protein
LAGVGYAARRTVSGLPSQVSEVLPCLHQVSGKAGAAQAQALLATKAQEKDANLSCVAIAGIPRAFTQGCTPIRNWGRSAIFPAAAARPTVLSLAGALMQAARLRALENVSCLQVVGVKPERSSRIRTRIGYLSEHEAESCPVRPQAGIAG